MDGVQLASHKSPREQAPEAHALQAFTAVRTQMRRPAANCRPRFISSCFNSRSAGIPNCKVGGQVGE